MTAKSDQMKQLENHLRDLLDEHESMLTLIKRKRDGLKRAQPQVVNDCTNRENRHVQRIGEIEKQRQRVVAALTQVIVPQAPQPLSLGQIAEHASEPTRGRLLVLQKRLHETMQAIQRESSITRRAMEGLLNHVQGIVQSIVQNVGGGGTYCRRGQVSAAGARVSSFNATA